MENEPSNSLGADLNNDGHILPKDSTRQLPIEQETVTRLDLKQIIEIGKELFAYRDQHKLAERIRSYRQQQQHDLPPDLTEEYESQLPMLEQIFGDVPYLRWDFAFHGTGKAKYSGAKYIQDASETDQSNRPTVVPVLEGILADGLVPQFDPWIPQQVTKSSTFAPSYMYAKTYAMRFNSEGIDPRWNFGDYRDWFMYYMADTMRGLALQKVQRELAWLLKPINWSARTGRSVSQDSDYLRQWVRGYTSSETASKLSPLELLKFSKTDISANWGAVLVVPRHKIQESKVQFDLIHEIRGTGKIAPQDIVCIFVPAAKAHEAELLISQSGLSVPVLSMESADYYLAKFPLGQTAARPMASTQIGSEEPMSDSL